MIYQELILLPVLALVLLTFIVWLRLYVARIGEMRAERVHPQALATRSGTVAALKASAAPADNFMNLFEMPVLFYVLATLLYTSGLADLGHVALAFVYVALRYVHSLIHITYNRVMHRFLAYAASSIVLWVMWGRFAWQLFELTKLNVRG